MGLEEEIKKLIKSGFKLELISSEMDVPIEQVKQWDRELKEQESNSSAPLIATISDKPKATKSNYNISSNIQQRKKPSKIISNTETSKMQKMRDKYKILYEGDKNKKQEKQTEQLSEEDIEAIRTALVAIESKISEWPENASDVKKEKFANIIWRHISIIKNYPQIPSEESKKFFALINSEKIQELRKTFKWFAYNMSSLNTTSALWLSRMINSRLDDTEDIKELEELKKMITPEMERKNPVAIGGVKSSIERKISAIRQKNAVDRIRNNIPSSILGIITDLANGEIDLQKANELITHEARRRVESKPKTRFSLTEEQEKSQILNQLKTVLMENPDKYNIKNPLKTVTLLEQLCGGELGEALRTVVTNLIGGKRFEGAKIVCNKFSAQNTNGSQNISYIRRLRENIKNAEIADMVLRGLNTKGTPQRENEYFDLIETGLKHENISPKSITLGKSKDGTRTITLADIWVGESVGVNR